MIRLHPYTDADAERVSAFTCEAARLDATLRPVPLEEWRSFVGRSFNHDGRDFALAIEDDALVGLLMSTRYEEPGRAVRNVRILVHPRHRRRGIATQLADLADGQDAAGSVTFRASCLGAWTAGARLLQQRGFEPGAGDLEMHRSSGPMAELPTPPAGLRIRPYEAGAADDGSWITLNNEAYAGSRSDQPLTHEDCASFRKVPGFALWFAEVSGEPVGLCHAMDYSQAATINSLVTAEAHRGRGIATALLAHALRALDDRGRVQLWVWADNRPARALYERLGFRTVETTTVWERPPGGDGAQR